MMPFGYPGVCSGEASRVDAPLIFIVQARMRFGFFGGSFDPPHLGHRAVALAARERFCLDRVLLAPTARQPLKPGGPQAPYEERLAMVRLLCADTPGCEASEADEPRPDGFPNYTIDTLARLRAQLGGTAPLVILGVDAFLDVRHWHRVEDLLESTEWIVVSRPKSDLARLEALNLTPAQSRRVHLLSDVWVPVSATDVRTRLAAGLSCAGLLPAPVLAHIQRQHLYGV